MSERPSHNGLIGPEPNGTGGSNLPVSPFRAGLAVRCPRCGKGRLFKGFLNTEKVCGHCGLDFSEIVSGDGPAVFIILIVGALVTFSALMVEAAFSPPYWVHVVLWGPVTLLGAVGLLRPFKAFWIALHYRNDVRSDRIDSGKADIDD